MDPLLWKRLAIIFFIAAGVFMLAFVYYSIKHKVITSFLYDMKQRSIKRKTPDPYAEVKAKPSESKPSASKQSENIKKSNMIKNAVSSSENIRKTVPAGSTNEPVMKTVAIKNGTSESSSNPQQYTVAAKKNTLNSGKKFIVTRSETYMTCSDDEISCIDNV